MISITELAKLYEVSIRTIRYYEEMGLINKSVRIKGKRYFTKSLVLNRMDEIIFLKSLNFKLREIQLTMENSMYVKPLLLNIRLEIARIEIVSLKKEVSELENILKKYNWPEIPIDNKLLFKEMSDNYYILASKIKEIDKEDSLTIKESKEFISFYKEWHKKIGINLSDEHIRVIAYHTDVIIKDNIKKYFKNILENNTNIHPIKLIGGYIGMRKLIKTFSVIIFFVFILTTPKSSYASESNSEHTTGMKIIILEKNVPPSEPGPPSPFIVNNRRLLRSADLPKTGYDISDLWMILVGWFFLCFSIVEFVYYYYFKQYIRRCNFFGKK